MTRTKLDLSPERQLITHLITSKQFAKEVLPLLKPRALKTRYAQVVSEWVQEYVDRFDDVPGAAIQDIYIERRKALRDEEEQESVAEFLQNLSNDANYDSNIDFYIDQAINYLKTRSLELTVEELNASIASGDPASGESAIANYKRVGKPEGDGYSILHRPGDIISAFIEEAEVALTFPGAVGKVVGPCRRGDLISFIAPVKRGKTWGLLYSAETAMSQGQRCVFITLEMPKAQILRRAWQSLTGSPKIDATVSMPYFVPDKEVDEGITEDTKWRIQSKDVYKEATNLQNVAEVQSTIKRMFRGGDCRFIPMPAKATTVKDIETVLDNLLYYNDYETDILIIDYADLMGAKNNEYRHQLDDIWSNLKRLAQERNILVLTATQTNRAGLSGDDLTSDNVAEDMRKLAHVSKFIALNQTNLEKPKGIMRWKVLLDRDEQSRWDEACALTCLRIGKFVLDSRLAEEMAE